MPYFGCHLSATGGYKAMLTSAQTIDADTFQFFTRNPRGSRAKAPDAVDANNAALTLKAKSFGPLVAHAPYTMNLCTKEADARKFAVQVLREDLERVAMVPGNYYNFHPGSHVGQGLQAGISFVAQALESVLPLELPATVLLETMAGKGSEIGGTFQELRMILDAVGTGQVGVCLDTCHVWDGGYDIRDNLDGVLEEFDQIIGLERLKALHLNDSKNPLGAHKDRHACLGDGCIGLDAFARIVNHPVLQNLPMILETPNELPGYKVEIQILRSFTNRSFDFPAER